MKRLYVAYTPYHVFHALADALTAGSESWLLLMADFEETACLHKTLVEFDRTPFIQVFALPGLFGRRGILNHLIVRPNITRLKRLIGDCAGQFERVFVAHDQRPESQYILAQIKGANKYAIAAYIEDGGAVYSQETRISPNPIKLAAARMVYGPWWQFVPVQGLHPLIDELLVVWPDLVRPELRDRPRSMIPRERLIELIKSGFVQYYARAMGLDDAILDGMDHLVLLPHSGGITKTDATAIHVLIRKLRQRGLRIAFKCHPREKDDSLFDLTSIPGLVQIPRSCPAELLYLWAGQDRSGKKVIAPVSTSLLTARWLTDSLQIIGYSLPGGTDPYLAEVIRRVGVEIWEIGRLAEKVEAT